MSVFTKQVLKDSTKDTIVKFVGVIDAGGALVPSDPNATIFVSLLNGARDANGNPRVLANGAVVNTAQNYYETKVRRVYWTLGTAQANGVMQLNWKGANSNSVIINMGSGVGDTMDMEGVTIPFDANGVTSANSGDLFLSANGIVNGAYTVIVELRKTGPQYNYGLAMDRNAFGPEGV
jgi:hypothetical protein